MVWSEPIGASIVLPSDGTPGGGKNYIVIGEDIPPELAANFTAAIVFWNGAGEAHTDQSGFDYYAIGFTNSGQLAIVAYFYVDVSSGQGFYQHNLWTLLSIGMSGGGPDAVPQLSLADPKGIPKAGPWVEIYHGLGNYYFPMASADTWVDINNLSASVFVPMGYEMEVCVTLPNAHTINTKAEFQLFVDGNLTDTAAVGGNNEMQSKVVLTGSAQGQSSVYINTRMLMISGGGNIADVRFAGGSGPVLKYKLSPFTDLG